MTYAVVKHGVVENIIVATEQTDNLVPVYSGIQIGGIYDPNNTISAQFDSLLADLNQAIEEGLQND